MKSQTVTIAPEIQDGSRNPKRAARLAALFTITLLALSPAVLHAQSVAFISGQTTVPTSNISATGVALDRAGDLFIVGPYGASQVIEITPSGVQTTVPTSGLFLPRGRGCGWSG
jgi:hypothetical protein